MSVHTLKNVGRTELQELRNNLSVLTELKRRCNGIVSVRLDVSHTERSFVALRRCKETQMLRSSMTVEISYGDNKFFSISALFLFDAQNMARATNRKLCYRLSKLLSKPMCDNGESDFLIPCQRMDSDFQRVQKEFGNVVTEYGMLTKTPKATFSF